MTGLFFVPELEDGQAWVRLIANIPTAEWSSNGKDGKTFVEHFDTEPERRRFSIFQACRVRPGPGSSSGFGLTVKYVMDLMLPAKNGFTQAERTLVFPSMK